MNPSRRFYRYLMPILVAAAYGITSGYLLKHQLIYTPNNQAISALTTCLFVLGFVVHLATITRVNQEVKLINSASSRALGDFSITRLDEIYNRLPYGSTKSLISDLRSIIRENKTVSLPAVQELLSSYSLSTSIYLQFFAATALLLGLLGTFMGIIQAINAYSTILPSTTGAMKFLTGIMSGLDKAFGTTIAGMVSSVCLSCLLLASRALSRSRLETMRSFLLTRVLPTYSDDRALLLERIIDASINRVLPALIRDTSKQLLSSAELIEKGSQIFSESGARHLKAADSVITSIDAHAQLAEQLRAVAARLDERLAAMVSISDANSKSLTKLSAMQNDYYERSSELTTQLGQFAQTIANYTTQNAVNQETIYDQMKEGTRTAIASSVKPLVDATKDLRTRMDQISELNRVTNSKIAELDRKLGSTTGYSSSLDHLRREVDTLKLEIRDRPIHYAPIQAAPIDPGRETIMSRVLRIFRWKQTNARR